MSALLSKELLYELNQENINTWFDLGLYIDQLRDQLPSFEHLPNNFNGFLSRLEHGVAFISFDFGIDGVSMEVCKYAKAFEQIKQQTKIHFIAGTFKKGHQTIIEERWFKHEILYSDGFNGCSTYAAYFETKLSRGSKEYNKLIAELWQQTLGLCRQIGDIIEQQHIQLLIPCNINANPGNVALALAIVIVSEKMKIPVLNNSHDFYWEDGRREEQRKSAGVRDHFFTNAHLGEVFTLIEMLYPWDSSLWFQTVLSSSQETSLIDNFGFNPGNIGLMPTSVDLDCYRQVDDQERISILKRMELLLRGDAPVLLSKNIKNYQNIDKNWVEDAVPLLLGYEDNLPHTLLTGNLLFLQPTRIIARKRIEYDFDFIQSLLIFSGFKRIFDRNSALTITMYVSGPLAYPFSAHCAYFNKLTTAFGALLESIDSAYRKRVFLAFNFGAEKNELFVRKSYNILRIQEIYAVANLVLLPSKQEGRGLPLLEAAAVEIPILTSRYDPEAVFREVIGEHLSEDLRLKVFEYPKDKQFSAEMLTDITELLFNPYGQHTTHNVDVIKKRYSVEVLAQTIKNFLHCIWSNCQSDAFEFDLLQQTFQTTSQQTLLNESFKQLVLCENRKYIAGISSIGYMSYLKSLIDPSAFRMEEKEVKGRMMHYAHYLINTFVSEAGTVGFDESEQQKKILKFYQQLNLIFYYQSGEDVLAIDHSLSYRHRNRKHFPYREMTELELAGIVTSLIREIFTDVIAPKISYHPHNIFQDFIGGIHECVGSGNIVIDDSQRMADDLKGNLPFAWFPGPNFNIESLIFIWRTLRSRLGIPFGELLDPAILKNIDHIQPVSVFINITSDGYRENFDTVCQWVKHQAPSEITALYHAGLVKIIPTQCLSRGIHLAQLGEEALKALIEIKNNQGFVVSIGEGAFLSLDMLDMPSYRIGRTHSTVGASFMQLNIHDSYIQWIPAGLRPSLAYPTPIQTPIEFNQALNSETYEQCAALLGEAELLNQLREDADSFGTPLKQLLAQLLQQHNQQNSRQTTSNSELKTELKIEYLESSMITGLHEDGDPWSGAKATIKQLDKQEWQFDTLLTQQTNDTVLSLVQRFFSKTENTQKNDCSTYIAWNGGYILNAELVGKLALSEKYIGCPLGLLIKNGKLLSLPLFNKPALSFLDSGKIAIIEAHLEQGFTSCKIEDNQVYHFDSSGYNVLNENELCYFDLLYEKVSIADKNHIFYYLSGDTIIKVIDCPSQNKSSQNELQEIVLNPVGITLAFPAAQAPDWIEGTQLRLTMPGWDHVINAIEAGPRLIRDGEQSIEMQAGGWKTQKSIATQAARVDFMDMRGPKIAVGINDAGDLMVVAINGRIRESVGTTHIELAKILLQQGAKQAMGFDPGGSVTLVVDGLQLNITPYNKDYEHNPLSLPPQARFVGNAIIGYLG